MGDSEREGHSNPGGHGKHVAEAVTLTPSERCSEYWPGAHRTGEAAGEGHSCPAGHGRQLAEPTGAYEPDEQATGAVAPPGQASPAEQMLQLTRTAANGAAVPAGHACGPAAGSPHSKPAGHGKHWSPAPLER